METPSPLRPPWAAVTSVAAGTFVLVTSEFLPIGLLSQIAGDFGVTPGQAGLLVTTPGVVAALSAPILAILAGGADRRLLLIGFALLILLSNLVVGTAPSFAIAVAGRALLGVSVGGLWTFAVAVGRKLVTEDRGNRATSVIIGGISVGTVVGVPLGAALGAVEGWRFAFHAIALLCLAVGAAQLAFLPPIRMAARQSLAGMRGVLRHGDLLAAFAAAMLAASGHFAAYTYLEPRLIAAGAGAGAFAALLALYGAAGILGTLVGERLSARDPKLGFLIVVLAMAAAIFLTGRIAGDLGPLGAALALWGGAFGALPVSVQIWTYAAKPEAFETSSALTVTVFQIAVAGGSFAGGLCVTAGGLSAAFMAGTLLNLACAGLVAALLLRAHRLLRQGDPK